MAKPLKIVAFVPAKGNSERVSDKNTRILDGEHLFKRKLLQALDCPAITEVCLDTESKAMADMASDLPVTWLQRPAGLATNATDGHGMFAWECSQRPDADIWIQMLCTAPFVTAETIGRAIDRLLADPEADSLVAVTRAKQYCWTGQGPVYGTGRVPNSVELPETIVEAMSLYIVRRTGEGPATRRFGTRPILFDLDPIEQIDITHHHDLVIAETVAAGFRQAEVTRFRAMLPHLSSPVLSDILKERGHRVVLPKALRPTSGGKFLGRAKTIELAALAQRPDRSPDGPWHGIYGALQSYRFVRPGDVIMVATDVPEYAYFGDLNANLAIRSGAVGAVIDGATRDTADVRALGLPVYARGQTCDDIKYEGTLKAMNRPITMGEVTIANGDVVFADADGIVAIPRALWPEIEEAAWNVLSNEARIRMAAARGRDVDAILAECGAF
ncbi:cytidylyltransferase domain-containing protein [Sphingomonas elodea]|uniref:RraA family protein n=1 Tax=Sphingomonas elodea TaxID=179878 RepID=UPI00026312CB|nr:dimethylmenaquinone methyltransferase [Sphingomonas elodea]